MRRDAKGWKSGPPEARLATGQEPRDVGGRPEVKRAWSRAWRLIWQVTGIVGITLIASLCQRRVAEVRAACVVLPCR